MTGAPTFKTALTVEDFVKVKPVVMMDFPDAASVFFVVGNQSFCVTPYAMETADDAELIREQLCHALRAFVAALAAAQEPKP